MRVLIRSAAAGAARSVRRTILELRSSPWETALFAGALLVYAITRFWRLGDYPISFFGDEAYQPVAAEELLHNGFRNGEGRLFPMYFLNDGVWVPLLPVWFHVVSVAVLGKSVEIARGTAAFFTLLGAAAVGLTLKLVFRNRFWWSAPLFLAATPSFFLHSRTTFETVYHVAFFAGFLLFYLLYRCRSPFYLYPAVLAGGCAFYSYSVGQVVVAVAAALLFLSDLPYHLRHWRHLLAGLGLLALVAVPLYRLNRWDPHAAAGQLDRVQSYWRARNITPAERLARYGRVYAGGLDPRYWFFPNHIDLERHRMAGYGHIRTEMLPLVLLGLGVCLWKFRSPPHRAVVLCALAAPSGAALVSIAITRVLSFVVPAAILATLGASALLDWVRRPRVRVVLQAAVFAALSFSSFSLFADALKNGARWYRNYDWAHQWGAEQLFRIIPQYLKADPETRIVLTSDWANGPDLFPRFFLKKGSSEAARISMGTVKEYSPEFLGRLAPEALEKRIAALPHTVFVMTPGELKEAGQYAFSRIRIDRVLNYPDGKPGFFFVRLESPPETLRAQAEKGRETLRKLVDDEVVVDGESLPVRHSRMDKFSFQDVFDEDPRTPARFNSSNPAVIEIQFPRPRPIRRISLGLSFGNWEIQASLRPPGSVVDRVYWASDRTGDLEPDVEIPIDKGPPETEFLRLEICLIGAGDYAIIHVRELKLQ